jgi:hypothetical protein
MYFLVLSCMPSLHGCLEHLDVKADVQVDAEKPEAVEAGEGNLPKEVL